MTNVVRAKQPRGKVIAEFIPTETFKSEEMGSWYVKGMTYYLREENTALVRMVDEWADNGMVKTNKEEN